MVPVPGLVPGLGLVLAQEGVQLELHCCRGQTCHRSQCRSCPVRELVQVEEQQQRVQAGQRCLCLRGWPTNPHQHQSPTQPRHRHQGRRQTGCHCHWQVPAQAQAQADRGGRQGNDDKCVSKPCATTCDDCSLTAEAAPRRSLKEPGLVSRNEEARKAATRLACDFANGESAAKSETGSVCQIRARGAHRCVMSATHSLASVRGMSS